MRVLIVGGTSSLARALKPALSEFAEVTTAGRTGCDFALDLGDPAAEIVLPTDIDVVVNTAACAGGENFDEMLETESVNVLGLLKLCQSCTKAHVKQLVQVSSIFACLDESSRFYGMYSLSKRHSDEVARLYCSKFGLPIAILRPSQFYGAGEATRRHQPFLSTIIDRAANGEDILIQGSNDALRNFIHVDDVAVVTALLIRRKLEGTHVCMSAENVRYSEVAAAAIAAFGSRSTIRFVKDAPDIPDNVFAFDDSLFRAVGYFPQISISRGMQLEAAYRKASL